MENLIILLFLIFLGWFAGTAAERRHLRSLRDRKDRLRHMQVSDLKSLPGAGPSDKPPALVVCEVVIATDYFKSFIANLRKLVGGEVRSYLSLVSRAREEATLRVVEEAERRGYNAVGNIRLVATDIGGNTSKKGVAMVTLIASGTAYQAAA